MSTQFLLCCGVDSSATTFTASWTSPGHAPSKPRSFEQTPTGFDAFQKALATTSRGPSSTLVVLEATGSYWIALATVLHAAGYIVSVINPLQAHHFAKALLRRAKTDELDATMLCELAERLQPDAWTPPPTIYHELRQRLVARDSLMTMRQQVRNQRHALAQWPVGVAGVDEHLETVERTIAGQIKELEQAISETLRASEWGQSAAYLMSIPGIGLLTASWLVVSTLNFSMCESAQAAAAYAGLVPQARESGTSVRGRRQIGRGGNSRLRRAVYLAAVSGVRHNVVLKTYYSRLRERGKVAKVALCAAARKLLHIAYAVVKKGEMFDAGFGQEVTDLVQIAA